MMTQQKNLLGYEVTLTDLFRYPNVRRSWQKHFPLTKKCVSTINAHFNRALKIPPSSWVEEKQHYGYLGTVYDHAIGLLITGRSPLLPIRDHIYGDQMPSRFQLFFDPLEYLLEEETGNVLAAKKGEERLDFFLALALLVDLHAIAKGDDPAIPLKLPRRVRNVDDLRVVLRRRYPKEFAEELQLLFEASREDLPVRRPLIYKPSFRDRWGQVQAVSSSDLLIGDVLIELKVSVRLFTGDHLWQLLACAALNANRKQFSVREVGAYNPRYRALWIKPAAQLVREMGSPSFKAFQKWFKSTLPKQMAGTGRKFVQVT